MIKFRHSGAIFLIGASFLMSASVALADAPTAGYSIGSGYLGIDQGIQVNSYISATVDGGGEFLGTISNSAIGSASAAFWCVDDQEAFYFGQSGIANVTLLSNTSTINSAGTRYGTMTDSTAPGWTNGAGTLLSSDNTAAQRYTLAAYLVSQYNGYDTQIASTNEDNAIQEAIWAITNTTTPVGGSIYESGFSDLTATMGTDNSGIGGGNVDSVSYWVQQAMTNASTVNTNGFAIVSWGSDANGNLYYGSYNAAQSANQTFVVELTGTTPLIPTTNGGALAPEPGFYGVLLAGLSGMFFVIHRRRKLTPARAL